MITTTKTIKTNTILYKKVRLHLTKTLISKPKYTEYYFTNLEHPMVSQNRLSFLYSYHFQHGLILYFFQLNL